MKWMKRLAIGLMALLVLCVGGLFLLPAEWEVTRTQTIDASPAEIHAVVSDWARWPEWSTFDTMDPTMTMNPLPDDTTSVGASRSWSGDQGDGEMTIVSSDPVTGFSFDLTMAGFEPLRGTITYETVDGGTLVTWTDKGTMSPFFMRPLGLFMDAMLGPHFESSLVNIDELATADAPAEAPSED